jgi:hypothetical protein
MHASREKKVACNRLLLENEDGIAAINSDLPELLMGMNFTKPMCVAIGVGQRMRGMQPICGQLWIQEGRSMTATNTVIPERGNSMEAVAFAGIVEASAWRHVFDSEW